MVSEGGVIFPFTAIVNQEKAKLALLIAAVNPTVGGVLLCGDKGTGKTTLVRALADLLPEIEAIADCPFNCNPGNTFEMCNSCYEKIASNNDIKIVKRKMRVVDLPLSITVDRLIGTLDIKRVLKDGVRALQPGLLAEANRNILYIDEVNLLEDYVADVLLDAAATGWNVIEREGVSVKHPARFILIGSMNPEEGELRPQILDRFGLFVSVEAPLDLEIRIEVVKRVEEFQLNPTSFMERYKPMQNELRDRIVKARELVNDVIVPEDLLSLLAKTVIDVGIRTHRAEIVTVKAAKAIAALDSRRVVNLEDLKKAMELALPHRLKSKPFESIQLPSKSEGKLQSQLKNQLKPQQTNQVKQLNNDSISNSLMNPGNREEKFNPENINLNPKQTLQFKVSSSQALRGSRSIKVTLINHPHGYPISYIPLCGSLGIYDIDLIATITSAALRNRLLTIDDEDLRVKVRKARAKRLCTILLDSSGSMAAMRRISVAKGVALNFIRNAYVKRDELALICFRGFNSEILSQPTRRYSDVLKLLGEVITGGRTPLPSALHNLLLIAKWFKAKYKSSIVTGILITDGKANVPLRNNVKEDIERLCRLLRKTGVKLEVYDTRPHVVLDPSPSFIDLIAKLTDAKVYRVPKCM